MRRQRSRAVVLRSWPWSETSLVLRVLTPAAGTVGLLARGACRPKSGLLGVLDTWHHVEIEYGGSDKAELRSLWRAELLEAFPGLARDPERLGVAAVAAELAELAAPPGMPAAAACDYLLGVLRDLDRGAAAGPRLGTAILQGLDLLGLAPILEEAPGRPGGPTAWFSHAAGGLVAEGTRASGGGQGRRLSRPALSWLRRLRAAVRAEAPPPPPPSRRAHLEVLTILGEFLAWHLERPPRAWNWLRPRLGRLAAIHP